jgi:DNA-binding MarR family transcriptional regulator
MKIKSSFNNYGRFLNLINALRQLNKYPYIEPIEEKIIETLVKYWSIHPNITVLQAANIPSEISKATWHRKIKSLKQKGIIEFTSDEFDKRVKYIKLSNLGFDYICRINQCLIDSVKD